MGCLWWRNCKHDREARHVAASNSLVSDGGPLVAGARKHLKVVVHESSRLLAKNLNGYSDPCAPILTSPACSLFLC
jgi:hypothetical protein